MHQVTPRHTVPAPVRHVAPTQIIPAAEQHLAPAPPPGMRVTGYRRIPGTELLEPVYGLQYEAPAPLPPPAPGIDPQAQRIAAWGVFALGVGVGSYFGMQALALALDSLVQMLIAVAIVGAVMAVPAGGRRGQAVRQTVIEQRGGMFARFTNNT
ncbi:hypothetical protein EES45_23010 [Streptomyces sp. ADI97-07]|uniref:hypothetical protein n=1 Tax=Streptomyces sp. ADI97-07 TaxID=1522762 RepID=UPI000F54DB48|nr:hypothetical protein [Streptomyces sp. ADI97-07]RPK76551.1 hypothetical protein EES45_23010 [Streptomyces sp. ADI97-07]